MFCVGDGRFVRAELHDLQPRAPPGLRPVGEAGEPRLGLEGRAAHLQAAGGHGHPGAGRRQEEPQRRRPRVRHLHPLAHAAGVGLSGGGRRARWPQGRLQRGRSSRMVIPPGQSKPDPACTRNK